VRRILAATDFSDEATSALEISLHLLGGGPDEATVYLLHAYHVPYEFGPDSVYGSAAAGMQLWKNAEGDVRRKLEQVALPYRDAGLRIEVLAVEGYPPEIIVDMAAELKADLVVTGTHGRTGLAHIVLGSTAERVIQKSPCPVLTYRRQRRRTTVSS